MPAIAGETQLACGVQLDPHLLDQGVDLFGPLAAELRVASIDGREHAFHRAHICARGGRGCRASRPSTSTRRSSSRAWLRRLSCGSPIGASAPPNRAGSTFRGLSMAAITPRRIDTLSAAMSVTFAAAIACVSASATVGALQHRRLIARIANGAVVTRSMVNARFAGRDPQSGDRLVQQAQHLAARRLRDSRSDLSATTRAGGERRPPWSVALSHPSPGQSHSASRRPRRRARRSRTRRCSPCSAICRADSAYFSVAVQLTARHGRLTTCRLGSAAACRIDRTHRHREHEPVADARVLAVADDGGAVVEEDAKQGRPTRQTQAPRRQATASAANDYADSTVHGGLQSNWPYGASQAGRRMPARRSAQARRRVENLLTDGEFPVERRDNKIFFSARLARIVTDRLIAARLRTSFRLFRRSQSVESLLLLDSFS